MAKIKEPEEFLKINTTIKLYGGLYANWKNSGCKPPVPLELMERLIEMQSALDVNVIKLAEKKVDE